MSDVARERAGGLHDSIQRARHLASLRRYEQAEAILRQVLAAEPGHLGALEYLARVLQLTGQPVQMLEITRRLVAARPDHADFYLLHARALTGAEGRPRSVAVLREAVRLQPTSARFHRELALALDSVPGGTEEAIASIRESLRLAPEVAEAHMTLSTILHRCGRLAEAEAANLEAIVLEPAEPEWRHALVLVRLRLGKYGEAREDILTVLRIMPSRRFLTSFARWIERYGGGAAELHDVQGMIRVALTSQAQTPKRRLRAVIGPRH